jgi:large conductance mechanosensitive channel
LIGITNQKKVLIQRFSSDTKGLMEAPMLKEFRDFLARGNVLDLAVAVILGLAFGAIVTSLVNDIIMPLVGIILGGIDFTSLVAQVGTAQVKYGNFIQALVNFLIIAFVVFMIVRSINKMQARFSKPAPAAAPPPPPADVVLLTEIRDLLKNRPLGI